MAVAAALLPCVGAPLKAQANLWNATLTVGAGAFDGAQGYLDSGASLGNYNQGRSFGSLNPATFDVEGTTYRVRSLRWGTYTGPNAGPRAKRVWLQLDNTPDEAERADWTLHVGGQTFAFADAQVDDTKGFWWSSPWSSTTPAPSKESSVTVRITGAATGPTVTVTPTELRVTEGSTATYDVVLAFAPTAEVTVTVSAPTGTDVSVNETSLTFTTANWDMAQAVTVAAAHDDDGLGDDPATITHGASGGNYDGVTVSPVAVTVEEDDKVNVSAPELTVTEGDAAGGTYDVTLATAPSADVTVTVSLPADTDVSVNKTSLTFTTANWDMAQTVTVTAAHDDDKEHDTATIGHSASGGGYGGAAANVVVTVLEDDFGVVVSPTMLAVTEGARGRRTYTVTLDGKRPSERVTVYLSASPPGKLRLSRTDLEIFTSSWDRPREVHVEPLDDNDAMDETVTISHSAFGGGYDGLTADVVVTVDDDEELALYVSRTRLTVTEGDSQPSCWDVRLQSRPSSDVTVSVSVPADADVSVNKTSLTFTTANWQSNQRVCLTAAHDTDGADETVTISHSASGGGYDAAPPREIVVTVRDDDDIAVSVSPPTLTVTEGDSTGATYDVVLTTVPSADVTVTVSVPANTDVSVNKTSLTFTTTNWDMAQPVTVTAAHDDDGANDAVTIGHSASGGGYDGLTADVHVTVDDDDEVPVNAADVTVSEGAGNATLTLSLTRLPGDTRAVTGTVTPTAGTAGASDYTAGAVSFTIAGDASSVDIDIPVTDDSVIEDEERFTAVIEVTSPADGSIVAGDPATVTITDNDAGVLAIELASATVSEGAGAKFDVTVTLKDGGGNDLTLPAALDTTVTPTFGAGEGKAAAADMTDNAAKTLTIAAGSSSATAAFRIADDRVSEPDEALSFVLTAGTLPAAVTIGTASVDATIANANDKQPGREIWSATLTVGSFEINPGQPAPRSPHGYAGPNASFQASFGNSFGALSDDDFIFGGTSYVVRSVRWGRFRRGDGHLWLQLDGTPDKDERDAWTLHVGDREFPFVNAALPSGKGEHVFRWENAYKNRNTPALGSEVAVRITTALPPNSLTVPRSLTVTEGDSTGAAYQVGLTTVPSADVTVTVTAPQDSDVSVNPPSLTFTTANWNRRQTVTVTAAHDEDKLDDTVTITHGASGGGYDDAAEDVLVTVEDDDKAEVTVTPPRLTVTEGDSAGGAYDVGLTSRPSADVTVTVTVPTRHTDVSVDPPSLTFTTSNWNVPRMVTVTAAHDLDTIDETVVIRHAASGDGSVVSVGPTVTVTVVDDDDTHVKAVCSKRDTAWSDPFFGCQWQLENADPARLDINVADVWAAGHVGAGVSVAVIDTGIDPTHPDLIDNLDASRHWNYETGTRQMTDQQGHGTAVAGIIAARDNGIGGRGVAPRARIHAYNSITILTTSADTGHSLARDIARTAVSNNSWGDIGLTPAPRLYGLAIDQGLKTGHAGKGTFYVFASGNYTPNDELWSNFVYGG